VHTGLFLKGKTKIEGAEGNIWTQQTGSNTRVVETAHRGGGFTISTIGWEMGEHIARMGDEKCTQNFGESLEARDTAGDNRSQSGEKDSCLRIGASGSLL
jgi:hypothetical protein